jgi:hypothetical protein
MADEKSIPARFWGWSGARFGGVKSRINREMRRHEEIGGSILLRI